MTDLTQEQLEIKDLLAQDKSLREISRIMWDRESKESTIRRWIKAGVFNEDDNTTVEDLEDMTQDELDLLCNNTEWSISNLAKRLRSAQRTNNQLRKVQRDLFDGQIVEEPLDLHSVLKSAVTLNKDSIYCNVSSPKALNNCTIEILFSDLQIGKVSEHWNTEIAQRTLKYYGKELLSIIKEENPEKIFFCSLGDIIECAHKHKQQSAYSTDSSNAEQLANAIRGIWWDVLKPIFELGIPVEVVGVAGNHGADSQSGFDMFKPGRYCYDWVIYSALKDMSEIAGATHVNWNIPVGVFATYEIYGQLTVAEHGYLCKGPSETAMLTLKHKRATNLQRFVHRLVMGDLHHYVNYDSGRMQINSAFFGVAFDGIEYSGISGYHAVPAQIVNIHRPMTGVGQSTVTDTKVIQVAKGYNYGN